jgi:lactoylglutathione lyase
MASFAVADNNPFNFSWQQTMLRIKDPAVSVPFYERHFGFKLIHRYHPPATAVTGHVLF